MIKKKSNNPTKRISLADFIIASILPALPVFLTLKYLNIITWGLLLAFLCIVVGVGGVYGTSCLRNKR